MAAGPAVRHAATVVRAPKRYPCPARRDGVPLGNITDLLTRYYTALNTADYPTAFGLLSARRRAQTTLDEWAAEQSGITFADVRLLDTVPTSRTTYTITLSYLAVSGQEPDTA